MSKQSVITITDALGADAICARLGVSQHSVRHARWAGAFPGNWYGRIKPMCDEIRIECPMAAFNWRTAKEERSAK